MQVLVTGGAGFIGSHLVNAMLTLGWQVAILDNLSTGRADNVPQEAQLLCGDIRDKELVQQVLRRVRPTVVYHLAAQVSTAASMRDPKTDAEINVLGTLNLLEGAVQHQVRKVIFASSAAVYGLPAYLPIDEKHPVDPLSCYGVSKATAEKYLIVYRQKYGLEYSIMRYANVYGPGQNSGAEGGVVAIFATRFQKKQPVEIFGDGKQTRDFVYVNDVVAANLAATDKGGACTFNISSNSRISINALQRKFQSLTGLILNPIYRPSRPEDIPHSVLDNNLAKQLLGWQPLYDMDTGLEETINGVEKRR